MGGLATAYVTCPACHERVPLKGNYCRECGEPITERALLFAILQEVRDD